MDFLFTGTERSGRRRGEVAVSGGSAVYTKVNERGQFSFQILQTVFPCFPQTW